MQWVLEIFSLDFAGQAVFAEAVCRNGPANLP
jgi:hypothetical protein